MRVLWVTAEPPDRNAGGAGIRQAHLITALAEHAEVDLLLVGHLVDELTLDRLGVVTEVRSRVVTDLGGPVIRRVRLLAGALRRFPPEVASYRSTLRDVRTAFAAMTDGHSYDRVMVDHVGLAPLIGREPRRDWAITFHNVGSATFAQEADLVAGRQRVLLGRQASQARRFEAWAMHAYGRSFAVSSDDAALLPAPSTVIPNGVDLERYVAAPIPAAPRIVMVGTLGYRPNVDGIMWFVDEVLPTVREAVPQTTLTLVGRRPVDEITAVAQRPGIELHLDVPDVRPYLDAARMTIVPLRFGSGTRLKALEAFAAGRPVVGTTIGLAGLDVVQSQHAIVADEPEAFARGVIDVLTDDEVAQGLATAARTLVEERFDWKAIGEEYVAALLA